MEKDVERATVKALKALGFICPKLDPIGQKGIPDRLILSPKGAIFFVEFKFGENDLSEHQKQWRKELRKRGFKVVKAYSKEKVIRIATKTLSEKS